jgi:hypothetical protein
MQMSENSGTKKDLAWQIQLQNQGKDIQSPNILS